MHFQSSESCLHNIYKMTQASESGITGEYGGERTYSRAVRWPLLPRHYFNTEARGNGACQIRNSCNLCCLLYYLSSCLPADGLSGTCIMKVFQVMSSLIILQWWQTGFTLPAELLDRPARSHNQSIKYILIDKISIMAHILEKLPFLSVSAIGFTAGDPLKFDWPVICSPPPHPTPLEDILPPE